MWCYTCQQEVPGRPTLDECQIECSLCGTPAAYDSTQMMSSKFDSGPQWIRVDEEPLVEIDESSSIATQTESNTPQRIAKQMSATRLGADRTNASLAEQIKQVDRIESTMERQEPVVATSEKPKAEPVRMTGFFIGLFLFGQVLTTWAFISAHFAAWLSGIAFSVGGVSIAMFSLLSQLDWQRRRIERLQLEMMQQSSQLQKVRHQSPGPKFTDNPSSERHQKVTV